jgi:hypothetical protein
MHESRKVACVAFGAAAAAYYLSPKTRRRRHGRRRTQPGPGTPAPDPGEEVLLHEGRFR